MSATLASGAAMASMSPGGTADIVEMVVMGLDVAVVAPLLVLVTRRWVSWDRIAVPGLAALPAYLLVHAALTIGMDVVMPGVLLDAGFHVALILASVVFWLPVVGRRHRLSDAGRVAYLFLAMPTLDLAGVVVVLRGDAAGGLAMIVGMLPMGIYAVAAAWQWVVREEREAADRELAEGPVALPA